MLLVGSDPCSARRVGQCSGQCGGLLPSSVVGGAGAPLARRRSRLSRPQVHGMMRRGFTLVELMVALAAGIAVAGAAYLLSKSSMEVFNQEARLSSAQFAATMGMNRMVADLQRAGFQMSPNIQADVAKRCGDAASTVPHANLKAIQILRGRSAAWATGDVQAAMTAAGVNPDVIRIAGNF